MQSGEFRISDGADRGQRVSCTRWRVFRPNAPAEPAASSGNAQSIGAQRVSEAGLTRIGNSLIRPPRESFQQRWTTARTDTAESFITDFPDSKQISRIAPQHLYLRPRRARTMLFVTAHRSGSGTRSFPRLFPKKDRPGSSGVESRARTERIREICLESGKSVMSCSGSFVRVRPSCCPRLSRGAQATRD